MQTWRLGDLLSVQSNNTKLVEGLRLIQPRATAGSLASYDDFEIAKLVRFRQIYHLKVKYMITSIEPLPSEMMFPKKINVSLPDNIYKILVDYYNTAYNSEFVSIAESVQRSFSTMVIVWPQIN